MNLPTPSGPPLAAALTRNDVADPDVAGAQAEVLVLFDEMAPSLRRYVRACGVPASACDDVVQDTFVALFRHVLRGGSRHNLRGWLVRVSFRLALKQRTRLSRRSQVETPWDVACHAHAADPADRPDVQLAQVRDQHRLREVFGSLPDRQQQCLTLRADGLRYREIALRLGVSLGFVAKAITQAFARLGREVGR